MNALQGLSMCQQRKGLWVCHDSTGRPQYEKTTTDNCKQSNPQNTKHNLKVAVAEKLFSKHKSETQSVLLNKGFSRKPQAEA